MRAGQGDADGGEPRVWTLPDAPGPEVARLRGRSGNAWVRWGPTGWQMDHEPSVKHDWWNLLVEDAPLTDATSEGATNG